MVPGPAAYFDLAAFRLEPEAAGVDDGVSVDEGELAAINGVVDRHLLAMTGNYNDDFQAAVRLDDPLTTASTELADPVYYPTEEPLASVYPGAQEVQDRFAEIIPLMPGEAFGDPEPILPEPEPNEPGFTEQGTTPEMPAGL